MCIIYHRKYQIKVSKQLEDTDGIQQSKQEIWTELTGENYKAIKEPFLAFSFLLILFYILESKTGTYNINECTPLLQ